MSRQCKVSGKHSIFIIALSLSCVCSTANARTSLGVGYSFGESEYKGYQSEGTFLPILTYRDDLFFLQGLSAGLYTDYQQNHRYSVSISYLPQEFDASNSSDTQLRLLDDRSDTALFDLGYQYSNDNIGQFSTEISADILGRTNGGKSVKLRYSKPFPILPFVIITPSVGAVWYSKSLAYHYYGISEAEASTSGLAPYRIDSTITNDVGLSLRVYLTRQIGIYASGRYRFLSDTTTDSPMVEKSNLLSGMVGISIRL